MTVATAAMSCSAPAARAVASVVPLPALAQAERVEFADGTVLFWSDGQNLRYRSGGRSGRRHSFVSARRSRPVSPADRSHPQSCRG